MAKPIGYEGKGHDAPEASDEEALSKRTLDADRAMWSELQEMDLGAIFKTDPELLLGADLDAPFEDTDREPDHEHDNEPRDLIIDRIYDEPSDGAGPCREATSKTLANGRDRQR